MQKLSRMHVHQPMQTNRFLRQRTAAYHWTVRRSWRHTFQQNIN